MPKIIIIASGKGGTGKTSLTAGIAAGLAERGHRVLAIDGDSGMRNLDIALGMTDRVVFSFADVAKGMVPLRKASVQHPKILGLSLLTAPMQGQTFLEIDIERLGKQLQTAGYEYCLIDGPAGLAPELQAFAAIATQGIVVSTLEQASVRGAERVARMLEENHLARIRLVVNRVRSRFIRHGWAQNIDDAMDEIGLQLLGVVPEDAEMIACANRGTNILAYKKQGAAKAYRNIARRLDGERLPVMRL